MCDSSSGPSILFLAVFLWGAAARPAQAASTPVTTCGQVLGVPGHYHLTEDLGPCRGNGVVITASGVHFTLAGFAISGVSTADSCGLEWQVGVGVEPSISFVRVTGGTVKGFVSGVSLHASDSRVNALGVIDNCGWGIVSSGARNVIDTNVVTGSLWGVFLARANGVAVRSNDISGNPGIGVYVQDSDRSTIDSNIVKNNGFEGIYVESGTGNAILANVANGNFEGISLLGLSAGSVVRDNTANGNLRMGVVIRAGSTGNSVLANAARGNGIVDLSDESAGCGANTWRRNLFATDLVAGVSDDGPRLGCLK